MLAYSLFRFYILMLGYLTNVGSQKVHIWFPYTVGYKTLGYSVIWPWSSRKIILTWNTHSRNTWAALFNFFPFLLCIFLMFLEAFDKDIAQINIFSDRPSAYLFVQSQTLPQWCRKMVAWCGIFRLSTKPLQHEVDKKTRRRKKSSIKWLRLACKGLGNWH